VHTVDWIIMNAYRIERQLFSERSLETCKMLQVC